jgi:hypothetical protein
VLPGNFGEIEMSAPFVQTNPIATAIQSFLNYARGISGNLAEQEAKGFDAVRKVLFNIPFQLQNPGGDPFNGNQATNFGSVNLATRLQNLGTDFGPIIAASTAYYLAPGGLVAQINAAIATIGGFLAIIPGSQWGWLLEKNPDQTYRWFPGGAGTPFVLPGLTFNLYKGNQIAFNVAISIDSTGLGTVVFTAQPSGVVTTPGPI